MVNCGYWIHGCGGLPVLCSPPHTHVYARAYIHTYVHTNVQTYVCPYVHMYIYTHIQYLCMYILQNLINHRILNYPIIAENNVLLDISLYSLTLPTFKCSQNISSLKVKYLLYFHKHYVLSQTLFHEEWISCRKYLKTEVLSYRKCSDFPLQRCMMSAVKEKVVIYCEKNCVWKHGGHSAEFLNVKTCGVYNVGIRLLGCFWHRGEEASW